MGAGKPSSPGIRIRPDDRVADWFVDTLQTPDLVKATASLERLRLLGDIGCVELAQDVAETIQPRNSLERLLAGQLASAHLASLKLLTLGLDYVARTTQWKQADALEACRLVNASARLMSVFQEGLQTLAKLRTGGKQTVVVQHVYVTDGGQAVVAGDLTTGGARAVGGVCENGGTTPCTATSKPHGRPRAVEPKTRQGTACQSPVVHDKRRCRMHGGTSPGAPRGNQHALKHGRYTAQAIAEWREARQLWRALRQMLAQLKGGG